MKNMHFIAPEYGGKNLIILIYYLLKFSYFSTG